MGVGEGFKGVMFPHLVGSVLEIAGSLDFRFLTAALIAGDEKRIPEANEQPCAHRR